MNSIPRKKQQSTKSHRHDKQWYFTYADLVKRIRSRDKKLAKAIRQFKKKHGVHTAQDMLDVLVQAGIDE